MKKKPELHELEFEQMVNIAAEHALDDWMRGKVVFRTMIWQACELASRWQHGQKKKRNRFNRAH